MRAKPERTDPAVASWGVGAPPEILVECEAFQGSIGLLFQMARDRKIDLLAVPLAPVCAAYLEYVLASESQDLEGAAIALGVLTYLIERKAWSLIPTEAPEPEAEDLPTAIVSSVHEYLPLIEALRRKSEERGLTFFRAAPGEAYEMPIELDDVQVTDLAVAFERLMARALPDPVVPPTTPRRSLSDQMIEVLRALSTQFRTLDQIVVGEFTRSEAVWWFLALLELIRLGQARIRLIEGEVAFARGDGG